MASNLCSGFGNDVSNTAPRCLRCLKPIASIPVEQVNTALAVVPIGYGSLLETGQKDWVVEVHAWHEKC
jgi:hypothetical protein